ncbi:MAG TPA: hypothetical protein VFD58_09930 [Blastocatellia bacterium]|nr:hypothetical protein [Blastocatellia bacterium]
MGVATRKRRKIVVNGRKFVWQVIDRMPGYVLQVISEDKHFLVEYPLGNHDPYCLLDVMGGELPGLPDAGHCTLRIHCPQFGDERSATSSTVRRLIEWCLYSERKLIPVDVSGKPVSPEGDELRIRQEQNFAELMKKLESGESPSGM